MTIRVNGKVLPPQAIEYELNRLIRFYSSHLSETEIRNQMDVLKRRAKEQAIGGQLLMNRAREMEILVPAEQVEERFGKMVENCGGRDKFDAMIQKQRLAEKLVRNSIEEGCRVDLLVERTTAGLPEPAEAEMRAHYEAHMHEYVKPEQAQARHILLKPHSDSAADRDVARSRLQEIRRRIEAGAAFADMAAAHSDCPSGRRTGGSLGWISRGTMVPEFEGPLFAMHDGEISDVVETSLGLHLISRTAGAAAAPAEYEEVKDKVRDFLRHVRRGEAIAAYVKELRGKAVIEED